LGLRLFINALVVPLSATLIYAGFIMMRQTRNSITPGMNISVAILYMSAFIGGILMLWLSLEKTVFSLLSLAAGRLISLEPSILPPGNATDRERQTSSGKIVEIDAR
jgi:TRAP-type C4-dicarboxylate transport system permease small subunit